MKLLRDWRAWSVILAVLFIALTFLFFSKRFSVDYAGIARSAAEAKGWKKEELTVSSMTMSSSPFTGDHATVVFNVGIPVTGKKLTVKMQRSVFGAPQVESIVEN